jgi:DNA polymerase alpha subunit B
VDQTPQQIFQHSISPKLTSLLDYSSNTTIILVPSIRDMISHNVVYPQAPLERDGLNLHKVRHPSSLHFVPDSSILTFSSRSVKQRAKLLPNPAIFSVNEVVFATTSADTLFSLKQNEYFKKAKDTSALMDPSSDADGSSISIDTGAASKDTMARMCRHVLRQRRWV